MQDQVNSTEQDEVKIEFHRSAELKIWDAMVQLRRMLREAKPEDRSELARRYAVTLTELEKVIGYYNTYVIQGVWSHQDGTE